MSIKSQIKKLVENLTDTHIYRLLPRGINLFEDIKNQLPMYHANVVFDVGANVGQSVRNYLNWFPRSQIYCFEPVGATFQRLIENTKNNERVRCFQLAFGASKGKGRMVLQGHPDSFFLLTPLREIAVSNDSKTEEVDIETIDEFCYTRSISHISYLKIDTEGGDLEVLRGAGIMLNENRIDLVEVEAGMNCRNKWHIPFEALKEYLESKEYFLFGIYEQVPEFLTKEPHLRRANPVFISLRVILANKR